MQDFSSELPSVYTGDPETIRAGEPRALSVDERLWRMRLGQKEK